MQGWGYAIGLLRSEQNRMLSPQDFARLSEAEDRESLVKNLSDSVYADVFTAEGLGDYEALLENHFLSKLDEIRDMTPPSPLPFLPRLSYDSSNLKLLLKAELANRTPEWSSLSEAGSIMPEDLFTIVDEKQYQKLPDPVCQALDRLPDFLQRFSGMPQVIDFVVDQAYSVYSFSLLRDPALRQLFAFKSSLENIKNICRAKSMNMDYALLPHVLLNESSAVQKGLLLDLYGESMDGLIDTFRTMRYASLLEAGYTALLSNRDFATLEKEMDEFLLRVLQQLSYVASGPVAVQEYIERKKMEIKNLKYVLIGHLNHMPASVVQGRLRYARL